AYEHLYSQPLTRVAASCWIYQHVPSGARTFGDIQDEQQLPLACGNGRTYTSLITPDLWFTDYNDDSLAKLRTLSAPLAQAQYYFISSARAITAFGRDGGAYPYMHRYYALLLGSKQGVQDPLGYTLVARFVSHPRLGPWTFMEAGADQDFNEYDHPPSLIFQNTGHLSAAAIVDVLT